LNTYATAKKTKSPCTVNESNRHGLSLNLSSITQGSGSIARLSIPAFRAEDPGPNPGRSTTEPFSPEKASPKAAVPQSVSVLSSSIRARYVHYRANSSIVHAILIVPAMSEAIYSMSNQIQVLLRIGGNLYPYFRIYLEDLKSPETG
jgi:hypothetical protein